MNIIFGGFVLFSPTVGRSPWKARGGSEKCHFFCCFVCPSFHDLSKGDVWNKMSVSAWHEIIQSVDYSSPFWIRSTYRDKFSIVHFTAPAMLHLFISTFRWNVNANYDFDCYHKIIHIPNSQCPKPSVLVEIMHFQSWTRDTQLP